MKASPFLVSSVTSSRMHSATSGVLNQKGTVTSVNMHVHIIISSYTDGAEKQNVDVVRFMTALTRNRRKLLTLTPQAFPQTGWLHPSGEQIVPVCVRLS